MKRLMKQIIPRSSKFLITVLYQIYSYIIRYKNISFLLKYLFQKAN